MKKKSFSNRQSIDSAQLNGTIFLSREIRTRKCSHLESRSMVITRKQLDELAYLLHANVQRADYERMTNPSKVEESK